MISSQRLLVPQFIKFIRKRDCRKSKRLIKKIDMKTSKKRINSYRKMLNQNNL